MQSCISHSPLALLELKCSSHVHILFSLTQRFHLSKSMQIGYSFLCRIAFRTCHLHCLNSNVYLLDAFYTYSPSSFTSQNQCTLVTVSCACLHFAFASGISWKRNVHILGAVYDYLSRSFTCRNRCTLITVSCAGLHFAVVSGSAGITFGFAVVHISIFIYPGPPHVQTDSYLSKCQCRLAFHTFPCHCCN